MDNHDLKLNRRQILLLAEALEADPAIEEITIKTDQAGKLHYYRVETIEKLRPIRTTPVSGGK